VSEDAELAAATRTNEHVDKIGRKAGRGLTWSHEAPACDARSRLPQPGQIAV